MKIVFAYKVVDMPTDVILCDCAVYIAHQKSVVVRVVVDFSRYTGVAQLECELVHPKV